MLYYAIVNLISFCLFFIDKRKAIRNKYRIPETTLLSSELIGGCFGGYLSMHLFHHKTKKIRFHLISILSILIHIYIIFKFVL